MMKEMVKENMMGSAKGESMNTHENCQPKLLMASSASSYRPTTSLKEHKIISLASIEKEDWKENCDKYGISVIIPMYNSENTIIQTLKALENQTKNDFEVIVINDGSTDRSSDLVTEFMNRSKLAIKLIDQENSGPAKARNVGVEHSQGEIINFLDSDCIPIENWVDEITRPLHGDVVGCDSSDRVRNSKSLIARYIDYECNRRYERLINKNIDTIGTNSASLLKAAFIEVGGFDTDYPDANAEDFDLAFRITRAGYKIVFTDKTFVYQYHPTSLRKYLKEQFTRGFWRVKMYLKNKNKILKGDSFTGHEPQVQFILSNVALLSIPLLIINPSITLLGFSILLFSNVPLGIWSYKKEKKFIFIAPIIAVMRSLSGALGVYTYFVKEVFKFK